MSKIARMITEALSASDTKKAEHIKNTMQGYVGADFAKKADDEDIVAMADLQDEKSQIYNSKMSPIFDKMDALRKKYKLGKMDRK